MARQLVSFLLVVLCFFGCGPVKADDSRAQLFDAIGERLALMKAVAQAKYVQGLPIEDVERERVVIAAAVKASAASGLTDESAQDFFGAQIEAAKIIQAYWFKHWARWPPSTQARSLVMDLRPKLLVLGDEIIQHLNTLVTDQHRMEFMRATKIEGLNLESRKALFQVLRGLRFRSALSQIQSAGILKVGTTFDYPPFSAGSPESPKGIDIQLALGIAQYLGVEVQWVQTSWPNLMQDFSAGEFDLALSGISITAERAEMATFSRPYHVGGKTPVGRCQDKRRYASFEAINEPSTRVIVNPGGTNEKFARSRLQQAQVRIFNDNRLIFDEISEGRADVMFTDEIEVDLQTAKNPLLCALLAGQRLTYQEKGILMPKDPHLVETVDHWLAEQIAANRVQSLKAQYLADQKWVP